GPLGSANISSGGGPPAGTNVYLRSDSGVYDTNGVTPPANGDKVFRWLNGSSYTGYSVTNNPDSLGRPAFYNFDGPIYHNTGGPNSLPYISFTGNGNQGLARYVHNGFGDGIPITPPLTVYYVFRPYRGLEA